MIESLVCCLIVCLVARAIDRAGGRLTVCTLLVMVPSVWALAVYASTKPEPPTPQPPTPWGPTNAVVIPTKRAIDGGLWYFWPSGDFEYNGRLPEVTR